MAEDCWQREARRLVDGNRERFPDLLVEQLATAMRNEARAISQAGFCRDLCLVALRMVKDAGKLKPRTDDERAAVELAGYAIDAPGGNRWLAYFRPGDPPTRAEYVADTVAVGSAMLSIKTKGAP